MQKGHQSFFEGVEVKLSILLANNLSEEKHFFSSGYNKWNAIFRKTFCITLLFPFNNISIKGSFAKLSDHKIADIIIKIWRLYKTFFSG